MTKSSLGFGSIGLVAVVGGGLFFGLRGTHREGAAPPARAITKYRLLSSKSNLVVFVGSPIPAPQLEYEVEGPPAELATVEARIVGKDGKVLDTSSGFSTARSASAFFDTPIKEEPEFPPTRTFGFSGYAFAPDSPQLVLSKGGKTVYRVPIPALPPPSRSIPLIVPLEDDSTLVRLPGKPSPGGFYAHRWKLATARKEEWGSHPQIVRAEWTTRMGLDSPQQGALIFGSNSPNVGGFAELSVTEPIVRAERQEATLDIEIFDDGTKAGLRILKPVALEFSNGTRVQFLAQERMIRRDRAGKLRSHGNLPVEITPQNAGLIVPMEQESRLNNNVRYYPLPDAPEVPPGTALQSRSFRLELLSPTQAELGFAHLEFGRSRLDANPTGPIAMGRFQVRVRVSHAIGFTTVRNRFIRIEP